VNTGLFLSVCHFHPVGRTLATANHLGKEETIKIKAFCLYYEVNYDKFASFSISIFGISRK